MKKGVFLFWMLVMVFVGLSFSLNELMGASLPKKRITKGKKESIPVKTINISGSVFSTKSYCGGPAPTMEIIDEFNKPTLEKKLSLLLFPLKNGTEGTRFFRFTTDSNGKFSIFIPPGKYMLHFDYMKGKGTKPVPHYSTKKPCYPPIMNALEDFDFNTSKYDFEFHVHYVCDPCAPPIP